MRKVAFVDIALNIEKIALTWTDNDLKNVRLTLLALQEACSWLVIRSF